MITVNSVSGGKTSAFIAHHFPADYNIFQLVRSNNREKALFMKGKDEKTRQLISDRIGMEFIGTLEDDVCIYTILDLEQFLGKEIVINTSHLSFEEMVASHGDRYLPSLLRRYCTEELKIQVAFEWWQKMQFNEIVEMRIGYRANEMNRMKTMIEKCDKNRIKHHRHITGTRETKKGTQFTWTETPWQRPYFPLIEKQPTFKDQIEKFWSDKPVRFAEFNNCVGCFHREPLLLKYMYKVQTDKMEIFEEMEENRKYAGDTFKCNSSLKYSRIKNMNLTGELTASDFSECDSGYCGM